jgi:uncharacterized protein YjbI with pentapeptide repeats
LAIHQKLFNMSKIKLAITNRWTGSIIFEYESENNTIKKTVEKAIEARADLTGADLRDADLRGADLRGADLTGADLRDADLRGADLRDADLTGADLRGADLRDADLRDAVLTGAVLTGAVLTPIKNDMFIVLLHSIPEVKYLKQNIIEGKIDGSTYDGECACLSGTLANGAKISNGKRETTVMNNIMSCRDSLRPIERFFLGIKIGDTPETSEFSKLALEWIEEFERLIAVS